MKKLALLSLLACCFLVSCSSDDPGEEGQKRAPNAIEASKVLYRTPVDLPDWAAWLGRPEAGETIVSSPSTSREQTVIYVKGRDLALVRSGQPPQRAISVQTNKMSKVADISKSIKSPRIIATPIGKAYLQPDNRRAYIIDGLRAVIVTVPDPTQMRPTLKYLRWIGSSNAGVDADPVRGRQ